MIRITFKEPQKTFFNCKDNSICCLFMLKNKSFSILHFGNNLTLRIKYNNLLKVEPLNSIEHVKPTDL